MVQPAEPPAELHHKLGLRRSYRVGREFNGFPLPVKVGCEFGVHAPTLLRAVRSIRSDLRHALDRIAP